MRPPKMHYEDPEFCTFEGSRMICPCGQRYALGFIPCDREGRLVFPASAPGSRAVVFCVLSGHIITADGVVIGQREVEAA